MSNIQDNLNNVNQLLKDSGSIETYDFNQKLMRKTTFKSNILENNNKLQDITKFKFDNTESLLQFITRIK